MLVPLEESNVLPSILESALIVAKRFDSYIEGLYEQPGLTEVVVAGEGLGVTPPDLVETFQQQEKERARSFSCCWKVSTRSGGVTPRPSPATTTSVRPGCSYRPSI